MEEIFFMERSERRSSEKDREKRMSSVREKECENLANGLE
jgi:hypothetical protein